MVNREIVEIGTINSNAGDGKEWDLLGLVIFGGGEIISDLDMARFADDVGG